MHSSMCCHCKEKEIFDKLCPLGTGPKGGVKKTCHSKEKENITYL